MSLTGPLIANAVRLVCADKELGTFLLAIKRGIHCHDHSARPAPDRQGCQAETRLAHADLIIRNGSDAWGLTDLGEQVVSCLLQHEAVEELALMYERLEFTADSVFLDLGCGAGPALVNACALTIAPRLLIGIDIDRSSLLAASTFLGPHQRRCLLVQADLAALPIKTDMITHVCSRLSLPYVDQCTSLAELGRVLKPGGKVFLQLHGVRFYLQLLRDQSRDWRRVLVNSFCLLNGFLFSWFGIQLRVRRSDGVYQELFQTLGGMRRLLKRHRVAVCWHEHAQLFRLVGWKLRT